MIVLGIKNLLIDRVAFEVVDLDDSTHLITKKSSYENSLDYIIYYFDGNKYCRVIYYRRQGAI